MPKPKTSEKLKTNMICVIHKENWEFVLKNVKLTGAKNESEWLNQMIRRLKNGVEK